MSRILYFCLVLGLCLAMYDGDTPVVKLNAGNYDQVKTGIWFVEYYASWCGHCQAMAPEWEKAARALKGVVRLAALDAGSERVDVGGIQGFPTIRFLVDGKE
jgi:protein disulfide-isomerase A6